MNVSSGSIALYRLISTLLIKIYFISFCVFKRSSSGSRYSPERSAKFSKRATCRGNKLSRIISAAYVHKVYNMPTKTVTCVIVDRANMIHRRSCNYYKWALLTGVTPADCFADTEVCLRNVTFPKAKTLRKTREREEQARTLSFRYCATARCAHFFTTGFFHPSLVRFTESASYSSISLSPGDSREHEETRRRFRWGIANIEQRDGCI